MNLTNTEISSRAINRALRSVYPLQGRFWDLTCLKMHEVWYPWFYCKICVKKDTFLKDNICYRELVAVDGRRLVKHRMGSMPMFDSPREMDGLVLKPKITKEQAGKEAAGLAKSLLLTKNRMLKNCEITLEETRLIHTQSFILQTPHEEPGQWVYMDPNFKTSYKLSLRPEICKPFLEGHNA